MELFLETAAIALIVALLVAVVFQTIRTRAQLGELALQNRQLQEASYRDELTGLANRRVLQELLNLELAQARRVERPVGLVILDVDDLSLVNEGLGFAAGDRLLKTLARRLEQFTREADTLARLDGDRFALVLARCERASDIFSAVYRLRQVWDEPLSLDGQELAITCSVGLSLFPDDASDALKLIEHAETALAHAEQGGANQLSVFDEASNRLARQRLLRGQELKRALRDGQFELHLQPQLSIPDGRLTGAEGLIRWRHPSEGLLNAIDFVPLAEQIGLMPEVSTWVLDEICRQSAAWRKAGLEIVPISVNVSARHFQREDVPAVVTEILERHGLEPRYLHLEVTESAALHDVELMTAQLGRLKGLGVGLQLDDFGTGYSSLTYLMRYPLDVLKIDRSFVTALHERDQSRAIVKATLAMAESLGLDVVAEGIETEAELDCLVELGCRKAQGFLLGEPRPSAEFEQLMRVGRVELPGSQAA